MLRPGPTLTDVAQRAGVSRVVAGHVLNGGKGNTRVGLNTIARVLAAAADLGYRPDHAAMILRGKRSMTYGLLVDSAGDPLRSFLVQHVDEQAARRGCHLLIGNTTIGPDAFERNLADFRQRRVDGVVCAMYRFAPEQHASLLAAFPDTVFYDDAEVEPTAIAPDHAAAARLAVGHLREIGCLRIGAAMLSSPDGAIRDRLEGFRQALREHGCGDGPRREFQGAVSRRHFAWDSPPEAVDELVDQAIAELVQRDGADGLVVQNDFWASVFLRRLRVHGFEVPRQVAVIGYLNHYLAEWTDPALSSIDPGHAAAAAMLVDELERRIAAKGDGAAPAAPERQRVAPRLIARSSTLGRTR